LRTSADSEAIEKMMAEPDVRVSVCECVLRA